MRRGVPITVFCCFLLVLLNGRVSAQRVVSIDSVVVTASRPLSDIGVQKTVLDSAVLRENITVSIADVLSQSTAVFVKSHGRATMATASLRGTSASHTQVTWNGMNINSPMLGTVDFSYIPAYLIDKASLYHGASSTGVTAGGLGGAVALSTDPKAGEGFGLNYVQGVSSFRTLDEFLKINYGSGRLRGSTRMILSTSANDFPYTNYDKKDFVLDGEGNVTGFSFPVERNKNCAYRDFHALQELFLDAGGAGKFSLSAWLMDSSRGIAMLDTDYREERDSRARQDETTLRVVGGWDRIRDNLRLYVKAGYLYTDLLYVEELSLGSGGRSERVHARNYVNTLFGRAGVEYALGSKLIFTSNISAHQHFVLSEDKAHVSASALDTVGYDKARMELSALISARWKPHERFGAGFNMRFDSYGDKVAPVVPALFVDYLASQCGNILLRASVARNFRFPTLNDLYFKPGGNSALKPESGYTYDFGADFSVAGRALRVKGGVAFYDSHIDNWILWVNRGGGYFKAENIRKVRSYGAEVKGSVAWNAGRGWKVSADGIAAYTRSVNEGGQLGWADNSHGRQLPYIPVWSSSVTGRVAWEKWEFVWQWSYYGERFTSTDNESTLAGYLAPYYMNDISLGRVIDFKGVTLSLRLAVNNLFGEEYQTELARPMAGRNFGLFIGIVPHFSK